MSCHDGQIPVTTQVEDNDLIATLAGPDGARLGRMRRALNATLAAVTAIGSLIAIASARDAVWAWLYPLPLIAILAGALTLSWVYIWLSRRTPSEEDQARLDRLLGVLPRKAIRRLEGEDFLAPWRERTVYPLMYYINELDGREEHFSSRALERRRARLYSAADRFMWAEAKNGFVHEVRNGLRNTGWTGGELEEEEEKLALAEQRARELRGLAGEVIAAHDSLLALASRHGYNLTALASEPPVDSWRELEPAGSV